MSEVLSVNPGKSKDLSRPALFRKVIDRAIWDNNNFRTFVISEFIVLLGNHFYALALPWLAMEMTGSAQAMGVAIALSGIPRMALTMLGGLLSDRHSPRIVIMIANIIRAIILAIFTWSILAGWLDLIVLYGLSFATGLSDALSIPAHAAIMPTLVESELLGAANLVGYLQNIAWGLVGPILAGLIISGLNQVSWLALLINRGHPGVTVAFAIDLIAIMVSSFCLCKVKSSWQKRQASQEKTTSSLIQAAVFTFSTASVLSIIAAAFGSIRELINMIWHEANLRMAFLMVYGINLLSSTPLYIGMPMLAASRFPQGVQGLGFLASAISTGGLLGTILAGLLPQPSGQQIPKSFLLVLGGLFLGVAIMLFAWSITVAIVAVLLMAASISYVNIIGTTQIQRQTPPELMGRMMGLLNLK